MHSAAAKTRVRPHLPLPFLFHRIHTSCLGTTVIELLVAVAFSGIVLASAMGWFASIAHRQAQAAAYLIKDDLRLAQQAAINGAGGGPRVEMCFRTDGYDVYTIVYNDPINDPLTNTAPVLGTLIKSVHAGQEYASGTQITLPGSTAIIPCTVNPTRNAIAFIAAGAPDFSDQTPTAHAISVTLNGQTFTVTIQPDTGLATVSP